MNIFKQQTKSSLCNAVEQSCKRNQLLCFAQYVVDSVNSIQVPRLLHKVAKKSFVREIQIHMFEIPLQICGKIFVHKMVTYACIVRTVHKGII